MLYYICIFSIARPVKEWESTAPNLLFKLNVVLEKALKTKKCKHIDVKFGSLGLKVVL